LAEFRRTRDLSKAARALYTLALELRRTAEALIKPETKQTPQRPQRRPERIKLSVPEPQPLLGRIPLRKPRLSEIMSARKWAREFEREAGEGLSRIVAIALSLAEHLERVRLRLLELMRESSGGVVPFSKLARSREEAAEALMSLLHLEVEGEVGLFQDSLFDEILVEVKRVREA